MLGHIADVVAPQQPDHGITVPEVVDADLPQPCVFQALLKRIFKRGPDEYPAAVIGEHPFGKGPPLFKARFCWVSFKSCRVSASCGVMSTLRRLWFLVSDRMPFLSPLWTSINRQPKSMSDHLSAFSSPTLIPVLSAHRICG